jgi:hypothetical protein
MNDVVRGCQREAYAAGTGRQDHYVEDAPVGLEFVDHLLTFFAGDLSIVMPRPVQFILSMMPALLDCR